MKKDSLAKIKFSNLMSGEALESNDASGRLLTLYNTKKFRVENFFNKGNIFFL